MFFFLCLRFSPGSSTIKRTVFCIVHTTTYSIHLCVLDIKYFIQYLQMRKNYQKWEQVVFFIISFCLSALPPTRLCYGDAGLFRYSSAWLKEGAKQEERRCQQQAGRLHKHRMPLDVVTVFVGVCTLDWNRKALVENYLITYTQNDCHTFFRCSDPVVCAAYTLWDRSQPP